MAIVTPLWLRDGIRFFTGHLLWWCERRDNPSSFPPHYVNGVVEAMWWIACTIVSGGCDNKYVASRMGRAIGFAWMVGGIVLLATFTSVLTATMTAERVVGRDPRTEGFGRSHCWLPAGSYIETVCKNEGLLYKSFQQSMKHSWQCRLEWSRLL